MTITQNTLQRAKESIDSAVRDFARKRRRLFDSNGVPIYSPENQAEQEQEFLSALQAAVDKALQVAEEAVHQAAREEAAAQGDPFAVLTDQELQRPSAMAPFIESELTDLNTDDLAERLAGLAHADKPTKWAYHRLATSLADRIRQSGRRRGAAGIHLSPAQTRRLSLLSNAARDRAEGLQDSKAEKRQAAAHALRTAAQNLRIHAHRAMRTASGRQAELERGARRLYETL